VARAVVSLPVVAPETMSRQKSRETDAFDRIGAASLPSGSEGRRLILTVLIVIALIALVADWWFRHR